MPKPLAELAATAVAKAHKIKDALIVDHADAREHATGRRIHRYRVVSAARGNEAAHEIFLADDGESLTSERVAHLFEPAATAPTLAAALPAAPITINPNVNLLTLNPGDTLHETITVTIPKNGGVAKADVYLLADTTGSMTGILNAVKAGSNTIVSSLAGLGVDLAFGVGNYKDFPPAGGAFQHQVSLTNAVAAVTAGINAWSAIAGGDIPEGQFSALDALATPPGGTIGWRTGSKRIVVWFGDAPGHDPICTAISGAGAAMTESSVTAKLVAEQITVLAISTATPGLDGDPKTGATDYTGTCGAPGGSAGQATRIANATAGQIVTGINPATIVNTIITLVTGAVSGVGNVKLVPSASIAPFVTSITPAAGYGPLDGATEHVLTFEVTFTGTSPCKPDAQVFTGTLDVVADGTVAAQKRVEITVPPCRGFVYSVKFVCGVQPDCDCECAPVQPGSYSTEINIHNPTGKEARIEKRFVPVVLAGAPVGREPRVAETRASDEIVLPPHAATMDDCCRIAELLYGGAPSSPMPLTVGYLELTSSAELAVTATYTSSGLKDGGVAIAVQQIIGRRQ